MSDWLHTIPIIGSLLDSIGQAIDKNITTDEERLKLKAELTTLYIPLLQAVIEADKQLQIAILEKEKLELQSSDWLIRKTRPLMAWIMFLNLVWASSIAPLFGLPAVSPDQAVVLFGLVTGIWGTSRGVEKIVSILKEKEKI